MKKVLTVLISLIFTFASVAALSGCSGNISGCSGNNGPSSGNNANNKIVLADFEKFEPDFQLMRLSQYFGAVNVNKNPDYVKSGSTSAKVQPLGHLQSKSQPWIYFPFSSTRFEYNYCDFTYYDNVSMWIYSTQDETVYIEFGLVEKAMDINNIVTVPGEMQRVKPGWNKIVYYPDLERLNLVCDVSNFLGVYLRFPNTPSTELEDAPVFYIDDVVLKKSESKQEIAEIIQLDDGEVLNFDKDWQSSVLVVNAPNEVSAAEVSIIKASEEGISVIDDGRSEEYVLKLVTKPCEQSGWPSFEIPSKVIKKSGMTGIPKADRSKYYFAFDVYAVDADVYFYPDFGIPMWYNWYSTNHIARTGEWTTYRISLSQIPSGIYGSLSGIRVSWAEYANGGERTFYFDNFRLEYVDA